MKEKNGDDQENHSINAFSSLHNPLTPLIIVYTLVTDNLFYNMYRIHKSNGTTPPPLFLFFLLLSRVFALATRRVNEHLAISARDLTPLHGSVSTYTYVYV